MLGFTLFSFSAAHAGRALAMGCVFMFHTQDLQMSRLITASRSLAATEPLPGQNLFRDGAPGWAQSLEHSARTARAEVVGAWVSPRMNADNANSHKTNHRGHEGSRRTGS